MVAQPKLSLLSETISAAAPISMHSHPRLVRDPKEMYREPCTDDEDNRYTVIVWRLYPGLSMTDYTLDDGRPVKFVDDRLFEIVETGVLIARET